VNKSVCKLAFKVSVITTKFNQNDHTISVKLLNITFHEVQWFLYCYVCRDKQHQDCEPNAHIVRSLHNIAESNC